MKKIYLSEVVTLDSNVFTGGGTDVTDEIQAILDTAPECGAGGLHIVLDGAALVRGLKLHSNTTIECPNKDCGLFLADHTDRPILSNYNWSLYTIKSRNIAIKGGTFNHNCTKQAWFVDTKVYPWPDDFNPPEWIEEIERHFVFLFEFYGVENFLCDDVTFYNMRGYSLSLGNFINARIENCELKIVDYVKPSNQDGYHIFGPGKHLIMKNLRGKSGDDYMNITPDELDGKSSIEDVLVDGVFLDESFQGIRILSKKDGRLDHITIRNVTGTYRTFGFSVIPFYPGDNFGNVGDICFENIDLRQIKETFHYTPLTFCQLGGNFENVTFKNVRFRNPIRKDVVFDIGRPFHYVPEFVEGEYVESELGASTQMYEKAEISLEYGRPTIKNFVIDGLVVETDSKADDTNIFELRYNIDNFVAKNIQVFRSEDATTSGSLFRLCNEASIGNMIVEDIFAEKLDFVISGSEGKVDLVKADNVILKNGSKVMDTDSISIKAVIENNIKEI